MALRGISGGSSTVSPWVGRCTVPANGQNTPFTYGLAGYNSNTTIPGNSGISADVLGTLTLPKAGKYLVQVTGRVQNSAGLSSTIRANLVPINQTNCALSGENSDGNIGQWFYDNNTGLTTDISGTGIALASADNAKFGIGFNITTTTTGTGSLQLGFIVVVSYLGA